MEKTHYLLVATVDHSINNGIETGITMRMINYNSAANGIDIGGGYGDGSIKYDLLKKSLRNGYPVMKGGTSLSQSLFRRKNSQSSFPERCI